MPTPDPSLARRGITPGLTPLACILALVLGPVPARPQTIATNPSQAHIAGHRAMGAEWLRIVAGAIARTPAPAGTPAPTMRGAQGVPLAPRVRLTVDAAGRLEHSELAASSGSAVRDRAALLRVARAAPFPAPPIGPATIVLPVAPADAAQLAMASDR